MPFCPEMTLELLMGSISGPLPTILAYLDPGTGSYVLQILLATMFGGMFALKQSWAEVKVWVAGRFGETVPNSPTISTGPAAKIRSEDIARPGVHAHSTTRVR